MLHACRARGVAGHARNAMQVLVTTKQNNSVRSSWTVYTHENTHLVLYTRECIHAAWRTTIVIGLPHVDDEGSNIPDQPEVMVEKKYSSTIFDNDRSTTRYDRPLSTYDVADSPPHKELDITTYSSVQKKQKKHTHMEITNQTPRRRGHHWSSPLSASLSAESSSELIP